jgi:nucleoside-diphosphate-sugar epimerase
MLDRKHTYSIERARKLLGYNPGTSLEEGMRRTEEWARAEGLL